MPSPLDIYVWPVDITGACRLVCSGGPFGYHADQQDGAVLRDLCAGTVSWSLLGTFIAYAKQVQYISARDVLKRRTENVLPPFLPCCLQFLGVLTVAYVVATVTTTLMTRAINPNNIEQRTKMKMINR